MTRTAFGAFFVLCAVAITFGNTLTYGFVWDDHFLIGDSYFIRQWSSLPAIFTSHFWAGHANWKAYYRPLINVSYLVDYQLWGLQPLGFHLTNVLVHLAASLAVLWICERLFRDWLLSFAAALFFAVHPAHSQSVSFIAGRTDLVATLFFLVAFGLYHAWRESGRAAAYAGAATAFLLGILSKEMTVVLPFVLLAYEWAFVRPDEARPFLSRAARGVGPLLVLLAVFLVIRVLVLSDMLFDRAAPVWLELPSRLLTSLTFTSFYAWVTIVPYPVSPSQTAPVIRSVADPRFVLAAAGLLVLLGATALAARRSRIACFWSAWFWLTVAPAVGLNLLPIAAPIVADRFLYLPSVAFCVLLAMGLRRLAGEIRDIESEQVRRAPMLAFGTAIVVFAVLTLWRNEDWKDDIRLYYRMADTDPQSLLAAVNLGLVHMSRMEAREAAVNFERALAIAPNNSRVLVGYGVLLAETGKPDEGLSKALRGLAYEPGEPSLQALVGRIYVIKEDYKRAGDHYREATRLQPHFPGNYFTLAYALMKSNHLREAARAYDDGEAAARTMGWHHRLIDRLGGELFAELDPPRAIRYWERYAAAIRTVSTPGDWEKSQLADAEAALRKLRGRAG